MVIHVKAESPGDGVEVVVADKTASSLLSSTESYESASTIEDTKPLIDDEGSVEQVQDQITLMSYPRFIMGNKPFCLLWIGSIVSLAGDWLTEIATLTLLGDYGASSIMISLFLWSKELPYTYCGPISGVVADMYDRRKIMIAADLARMVIVLGNLMVQSQSMAWLLVALSFLQTTMAAFFEPARTAMIPMVVEPSKLLIANTIEGGTWSAMLSIGASIGGVIAVLFGISVNYVADSFTYLASACLIAMLFKYPYKRSPIVKEAELQEINSDSTTSAETEPAEKKRNAFVNAFVLWAESVQKAFHYLRANKYIFAVCLLKFSGAVIWGGFDLVTIRFGQQTFKMGSDGSLSVAILYASSGFGCFLGPFLSSILFEDNARTNKLSILVGWWLLATGTFFSSFSPVFAVACICSAVKSCGIGLIWTYSEVIKEKLVPERLLGRIASFDMCIIPIGTLISRSVGVIILEWMQSSIFTLAFVYGLMALGCAALWSACLLKLNEQNIKN